MNAPRAPRTTIARSATAASSACTTWARSPVHHGNGSQRCPSRLSGSNGLSVHRANSPPAACWRI
ncbi:MAG TPA: hypothetical protein VL652_42300, partial [Kutzneria sp.]|nr:hypothetical protein [Kutzneria sp.]